MSSAAAAGRRVIGLAGEAGLALVFSRLDGDGRTVIVPRWQGGPGGVARRGRQVPTREQGERHLAWLDFRGSGGGRTGSRAARVDRGAR